MENFEKSDPINDWCPLKGHTCLSKLAAAVGLFKYVFDRFVDTRP